MIFLQFWVILIGIIHRSSCYYENYKPDPIIYCYDEVKWKVAYFHNLNEYYNHNSSFFDENTPYFSNRIEFRTKNFTILPRNVFKTKTSQYITSVRLEGTGITKIEFGAFNYLDCLKHLNLRKNSIAQVTNFTFFTIPNLIELDLSFNVLDAVPTSAFVNLDMLRILDLSHNKIQTIEKYSFIDLRFLRQLDISHNSLKIIHQASFGFTPILKYLHLGSNDLTDAAFEAVEKLEYLVYLDLSNNRFDHFEANFLNQTSLIELDLSENRISKIDISELTELFKLRFLDISKNLVDCSETAFKEIRNNLTIFCGRNTYGMDPNAGVHQGSKLGPQIDNYIEKINSLEDRVENMSKWMITLFFFVFLVILVYVLFKFRFVEKFRRITYWPNRRRLSETFDDNL